MKLTITKVFTFAAGHRLWDDNLSVDGNKDMFGKCINQHGHTYTLEVTIRGWDMEHGMVMNFITPEHGGSNDQRNLRICSV